MEILRTDYQSDVLDASMNGRRQYQMVENPNGTVSFVDVTEYEILGDNFGSEEVNIINGAVNKVNESLTLDTTELSDDFNLKSLLQVLAKKYYPKALNFLDTNLDDWTASSLVASLVLNTTELSFTHGGKGNATLTFAEKISIPENAKLIMEGNVFSASGYGAKLQVSEFGETWTDITDTWVQGVQSTVGFEKEIDLNAYAGEKYFRILITRQEDYSYSTIITYTKLMITLA